MYEKKIYSDGSCGTCGCNQYAEIIDTDTGRTKEFCTKCEGEAMELFLEGESNEDEDLDEEEYFCDCCDEVQVDEEGLVCDDCREEDEDR